MAGRNATDEFLHDLFDSDSYLGDFLRAVGYGFVAVLLFYSSLNWIAFLFARGGGTAATFSLDALSPPSTELSTLAPYLFGYVGFLSSALSLLTAGYFGLVRPFQRSTGMTSGGTDRGHGDARAPVSVETTDGTQRFRPDRECVDCEERAIGVVVTEFEAGTPSRAIPVCPAHLHERRDDLEAHSRRVEVETFV